jgi:YD repeat-containing protein
VTFAVISGQLRSTPDTTQAGTSYTYDGLGRTTKTTDPLSNVTTTSYSQANPQGANVTDTATYEATTTIDANGHQRVQLTDGFGRVRYGETFSGSGGSYSLHGTTRQDYDWLGDVTDVFGPNLGSAGLSTNAQTTTTYDLLGRKTAMTDADLGSYGFPQYDPNGNLLESVDPRGASGTAWIGYDGLNRPVWRNTTNSSSGAYVSYSAHSAVWIDPPQGYLVG